MTRAHPLPTAKYVFCYENDPAVEFISQDPPPWIPADKQHTTSGASNNAELHMLRAVDTGIINVSDAEHTFEIKSQASHVRSCHWLFKNPKRSCVKAKKLLWTRRVNRCRMNRGLMVKSTRLRWGARDSNSGHESSSSKVHRLATHPCKIYRFA